MRIEKASGSRAAHALLVHIRDKYKSIPAFAETHNLDRVRLQKTIRGQVERVGIDFAVAVERATNGEVPASWWTEAAPESGSGEHAAVTPPKAAGGE